MDSLRDFFNGWLLDHITGIFLGWVVISAVALGTYLGSANTSSYDRWATFIHWFWVLDTVFSVPAFVNWAIRILAKFAQQLWEDIKDIFRG